MKRICLVAIGIFLTYQGVNAGVSISCPTIDCGMDIGTNVCYLHSGSNPVSYIRMQACPAGSYCDIGDQSKYAWVDAQYQKYTAGRQAALSQVFGQKTIGYCRKASTLDAMLNNGRECSHDN